MALRDLKSLGSVKLNWNWVILSRRQFKKSQQFCSHWRTDREYRELIRKVLSVKVRNDLFQTCVAISYHLLFCCRATLTQVNAQANGFLKITASDTQGPLNSLALWLTLRQPGSLPLRVTWAMKGHSSGHGFPAESSWTKILRTGSEDSKLTRDSASLKEGTPPTVLHSLSEFTETRPCDTRSRTSSLSCQCVPQSTQGEWEPWPGLCKSFVPPKQCHPLTSDFTTLGHLLDSTMQRVLPYTRNPILAGGATWSSHSSMPLHL